MESGQTFEGEVRDRDEQAETSGSDQAGQRPEAPESNQDDAGSPSLQEVTDEQGAPRAEDGPGDADGPLGEGEDVDDPDDENGEEPDDDDQDDDEPDDAVPSPQPVVAPLTQAKIPPIAAPTGPIQLFNRELSWLEFNQRVLSQAEDPTVPLLERVKFLSICSTNLDEFFMVRVASIRGLVLAGVTERSVDGLTPKQHLRAIRDRARLLLGAMYSCLNDSLLPELRKAGIRIEKFSELSKREQLLLKEHFDRHISPILTPLAIDPGHPFPFLSNLALNLAIVLESERGEEHIALLKLPPLLPRLIAIPESTLRYIPLDALIMQHAGQLFPGLRVREIAPFRVIRNADMALQEDEVQDLLKSVESELRRRERREVVWIEIAAGAGEALTTLLAGPSHTPPEDVFSAPGFLKLSDLMQLYREVGKPSLRDAPFNPRIPAQLASTDDIFSIIRREDILLHRPYDSFTAVIEFVQTASEDPDVVAIKQTLYRTDAGSPIVEALTAAALRGKQVTAVVELQARFDEMKNIAWARRLEEAGVQVVYGLVGIKTHCKICLVVRREGTDLRRYMHLSTGNYNASTGRTYTDIDLFTDDEEIGDDATQLMNILTGFSLASVQEIFERNVPELVWKRLVVAPMDFHQWVLAKIEREIAHAAAGRPAQLIIKLNALVDPKAIEALYRASRAGVKIDLIVRGICCLVPGVPGMSEGIRVISIIDRFLEHSRFSWFLNGGEQELYVSSGDWMPRNFFRRIELTFPILNERLRARVTDQILTTLLADNLKAWKLGPDGVYKRRTGGDRQVRSQERFIEIARSEAVRLAPYEDIIAKPGSFRRKAKKLKKKEKK